MTDDPLTAITDRNCVRLEGCRYSPAPATGRNSDPRSNDDHRRPAADGAPSRLPVPRPGAERASARLPRLRRDRAAAARPCSTPSARSSSTRTPPCTAALDTLAGARDRRRSRTPARPSRASSAPQPTRSSGPRTRPTRSTSSRSAWRTPRSGSAAEPTLRARGRRRDPRHRGRAPRQPASRGSGSRRRPARRCAGCRWTTTACGRSTTAAAVIGPRTRVVAFAHVSNVTGAIAPVAEIVAARPRGSARSSCSTPASRCRTAPSTSPSSASTSPPSRRTRCSARPASACSGAARELLDELPPARTGGSTITTVTMEKAEFLPAPQRFEAGTQPVSPGRRLRRGRATTSTALGHRRASTRTRRQLDRAARRRGRRDAGRAPGRARRRARRAPRSRASSSTACTPTTSASSSTTRHRGARRPPLRAAAAPPARRRRDRPARAPTSTRPRTRSTGSATALAERARLLRSGRDERRSTKVCTSEVILDHSRRAGGPRRHRARDAVAHHELQPLVRRRDHAAACRSSAGRHDRRDRAGRAQGCSISTASASVLAGLLPGRRSPTLRELIDEFRAMLRSRGAGEPRRGAARRRGRVPGRREVRHAREVRDARVGRAEACMAAASARRRALLTGRLRRSASRPRYGSRR